MFFKKEEVVSKKDFIVAGISSVMLLAGAGAVFAQESANVTDTTNSTTGNLREEIRADREALKAEMTEIKTNAEAARSEEKTLREQLKNAIVANDTTTAAGLKETLKQTHGENVAQKQADLQNLKESRKELHQDVQAARKTRRNK